MSRCQMSQKRRIFFQAFKEQAVKMAKESGLSVCKVARRLDLNESSLRQWMETKKDSRIEKKQQRSCFNSIILEQLGAFGKSFFK